MKKILVGLSGGVDSAVSAYLLKKAGYDVTAGFMINYLDENNPNCPTKTDLKIAKEVAEFLKIPFFTFDYRDSYEEKVLNYMYEGYKKGITPNPDIMCNSEVKFKLFLEEALEHGFDGIATGHYTRIETSSQPYNLQEKKLKSKSSFTQNIETKQETIFHLLKGIDKEKDQSYFLAGLNQFQLSKVLFPIGNMKKSEVRILAKEIGLPNAERKDSQGICFVGKVDMSKFLEKKIKPKKGLVKNTSGVILGEHKGVYYYTIGQRKGLDIGGQAEPIFIVKKDIEKNEIIVGTKDDLQLYDDKLFIENMHFLLPLSNFHLKKEKTKYFPLKAKAKIRYRQADQDCEVFEAETSLLKPKKYWQVKFKQKQRAIARGQICAIYLGDELVMSGVIV